MALPRFWNWIMNKIRFSRFALSSRVKMLTFGAIYQGSYSNWKHDPNPQIFVMYSGPKYTHGINLHYMSGSDKMWFGNLLYMIKRGGQIIDGYTLYKLFKSQRINVVKTCYRVYFTNLLNMKLVSAGLTPLNKIAYTFSKDPFIIALNARIAPSEMTTIPQVAYSSTELQERIISAQNAQPIAKQRVSPLRAPAPWIKR